ncbi:unnamed protein product [Mytilus coruscus]|uniref:Uncharacterized protein n=1 Tax=Mytilus coruscus TaxID=42192 RepID=A0A6J8AUM6_MYTCO|nr:unnamed protein product [Mytilus coruscus]
MKWKDDFDIEQTESCHEGCFIWSSIAYVDTYTVTPGICFVAMRRSTPSFDLRVLNKIRGNDVFTEELDGQVPIPDQVPVTHKISKHIIREETVLKYFTSQKLDKSPVMDKLHPRLLKEIAESLAKPLCLIFNQSNDSNSVPTDWQNVMKSAIFKKGS